VLSPAFPIAGPRTQIGVNSFFGAKHGLTLDTGF
jgi:hypothetical protein